ncbi:MAG: serine/threonine protein kinase [Polyangiaceae bacterium]|nr:serine/threonine protein kinase [Polyangiaceae bacterium]
MTTDDIAYRTDEVIPGTNHAFRRALSAGGQGTVYIATDLFLGVDVIMKLGLPQVGVDLADALRTLQGEARAIAQLRSRHIVEVLGGGITAEARPRPYFTMKYYEGYTLSFLLKRERRLSLAHALLIAMEVLDGLAVAHEHATHAVIHRDIKPSNIFLHCTQPGDWITKILDFGVARKVGVAPSKFSGQHFTGTCDYAAPEQAGGTVTPSADLYAVSGVLFQMLTGRLLFRGFDVWDTIAMHRSTPAPRVSSFLPGIPKDVDDLIASGLEKDPRNRPRSAAEFSRQLRAIRDRERARAADPELQVHTDNMPLDRAMHVHAGKSPAEIVTSVGDGAPSVGATLPSRANPADTTEPPNTTTPMAAPAAAREPSPVSLAHADTAPSPAPLPPVALAAAVVLVPAAQSVEPVVVVQAAKRAVTDPMPFAGPLSAAPPSFDRVGPTHTHVPLRKKVAPQITAPLPAPVLREDAPEVDAASAPGLALPTPSRWAVETGRWLGTAARRRQVVIGVVSGAGMVLLAAFGLRVGISFGQRAQSQEATIAASTAASAQPAPAAIAAAPPTTPAVVVAAPSTAPTAGPAAKAPASKAKPAAARPPNWMPGWDGDEPRAPKAAPPKPTAPPAPSWRRLMENE